MNRESKEVINGEIVVRFNGNNCPSGRNRVDAVAGAKGLRKAPSWVQKKAAWAATKRVKEKRYAQLYLGEI